MQLFVSEMLASIPEHASADFVVRTLDATNDELVRRLGQTGFRPVLVPDQKSIYDEGTMDQYQCALNDAMVSACGMLVVKMAADEIVKTCSDLAPVILREIFGEMPTPSTFDVSRRFDQPYTSLSQSQINAMRIRDTITAHLDCNYVLLCTNLIDPGESMKAVMMFETKPGEDLPMTGMCHEDGDCTTDTIVLLGSPMSVDVAALVEEGEDPSCAQMDKDYIWNAQSHELADAAPFDTWALDEQRKSRIDIKAAMQLDGLEPVNICGARRISGGTKLSQRCISVKCTLAL